MVSGSKFSSSNSDVIRGTRMSRQLSLKCYDHLYERKGSIHTDDCIYCGLPAEHLDHIPPISHINSIDLDDYHRKGNRLWKVCSCGECNAALGNRRLYTIADRKRFLLTKYKQRYRKYYNAVHWDEDELKEMSKQFRKEIEQLMKKKKWVENRFLVLIQVPTEDLDLCK